MYHACGSHGAADRAMPVSRLYEMRSAIQFAQQFGKSGILQLWKESSLSEPDSRGFLAGSPALTFEVLISYELDPFQLIARVVGLPTRIAIQEWWPCLGCWRCFGKDGLNLSVNFISNVRDPAANCISLSAAETISIRRET